MLDNLFQVQEYNRLRKLYKESLLMHYILEYGVIEDEQLRPITAVVNIPEIADYTMEDYTDILVTMEKMGFIESGGIMISSLGKEKLQSGQLKTEAAQLNAAIQNIRLQKVLMILAGLGIAVQLLEVIIIPLGKYILK